MNEDIDWDPNWWKKKRDESLGRKKAETLTRSGVNAGDAFLVVTEGTVIEPVYLELFLETLELSQVWVKVIPGKASDPRHVIETGRSVADEQVRRAKKGELAVTEPARFDRVWAVIDTDVAVKEGFWNEVEQLAKARKVRLAHSTPSFEFWLLLHFGLTTRGDLPNGVAAKSALKDALGRDFAPHEVTAREAIRSIIDQWPEAVGCAENVRRHHRDAATPTPANPSTEMDRLARELNDSAPERLRKLK